MDKETLTHFDKTIKRIRLIRKVVITSLLVMMISIYIIDFFQPTYSQVMFGVLWGLFLGLVIITFFLQRYSEAFRESFRLQVADIKRIEKERQKDLTWFIGRRGLLPALLLFIIATSNDFFRLIFGSDYSLNNLLFYAMLSILFGLYLGYRSWSQKHTRFEELMKKVDAETKS